MSLSRSSPLRADAARNRERILRSARGLYAERGLDVTVEDVAEDAGVGIATVYRRFPDRDALVEALFHDRLQAHADLARQCLDDPDPWRSFATFFESVCAELATDKGLRQVLLSSIYGSDGIARSRRRLIPLVAQLLRRAQDVSAVRPDLVVTDVPVLLLTVGTVAELGGAVAPHLWRRVFEVVLEGLRPRGASAFSVPGLTTADLEVVVASYRPTTSARSSRA